MAEALRLRLFGRNKIEIDGVAAVRFPGRARGTNPANY